VTPLVDRFRRLPRASREALLERLAARPGALSDIRYDFEQVWARQDQIVDPVELERHRLVVFTGPRGAGKTRAAVQLFNREILAGRSKRPRIFAANEGDVEKAVIFGDSGIMACLPKGLRPRWVKSEGPAGVLHYDSVGVEAVCFSAKAPDGCVSHQGDLDFYDDVAKWGPSGNVAWNHARVSCRIGRGLGIVATTRRGTQLLKKMLAGNMSRVLVRRPDDVRANTSNLVAGHFEQMEAEMGDSEFFAQEMGDEEIEAGAPFGQVDFEGLRVQCLPHDLVAIAVWIDPSSSSASHSCEVGIVVVALDSRGVVYGVEDCSGKMDAHTWPGVAWDAHDRWARSGVPVHFGVEINKGGNMGPELLRQAEVVRRLQQGMPGVSVAEIRDPFAKRSKAARATPCATLAKRGHLKMLPGLQKLEAQLRALTDGESENKKRDRADAFVHGVLDLALGAYAVGGSRVDVSGLGPAPIGSINVGPEMVRAQPFQFSRPAGWI
jgi:phage terminase large subunit-like protein